MRRCIWISSVLGLVLITIAPSYAKGSPDKATISGPGLDDTVEITDAQLLRELSFFQFEQVEENNRRGIEAPANPGEGYVITRYIATPSGTTFKPWDRLHYYPSEDGKRGVIFLDGLIGDSSTEFDGRWYHASPSGDAAMHHLLIELGARQPPDQVMPATGQIDQIGMRLVLLVLCAACVGWLLRRRLIDHA